MKDRVKALRRVPASELRATPKNWRRHPPSQEAALRGVLEDIGFADAVIARETDDGLELIDGHLRQEVMGDQVVPVLIVDVTEEEADKMLLTYDPLAMMAHAAQDQLLNLLRDTQFESKAVNDMLEAVANGERLPMPDLTEPVDDPGPQIDRADELREKWQTERGQVWEVGRHRLMCGDSLIEPFDVASNMVFTDPPYNVNYGNIKHQFRQRPILNDSLDADEWVSFCNSLAILIKSKTSGCVYVCHAPGPDGRVMAMALETVLHFSTIVIWVKDVFTLGRGKYQNQYEPIWFGWNNDGTDFSEARNLSNVWQIPRPFASDEHPTMKPVELVSLAIRHGCQVGQTVLDPFLGSGTTMVAAEQLGRICYGMEIEPKYVAVTLERMSGMGLEPKLVE